MESVYKSLLYVSDKLFPYVISKSDHDLINGGDVRASENKMQLPNLFESDTAKKS